MREIDAAYPGHYLNTLDLFSGSAAYVDLLAYTRSIVRNTTTCVSQGSPGTTTCHRAHPVCPYLL